MMKGKDQTRREFIKRSAVTGVAIGAMASSSTAASYGRISGANDRIRVGMIGCGGRSRYHMGWIHRCSREENVAIVAACDIWIKQRERATEIIKERFGMAPRIYKYYQDLLDDPEIDGVVIATPDHQHCAQLCDAVRANKDVYVEKPICNDLDELNRAYDVVKSSKSVVQHGTQGRSSRGAGSAREFFQSGKLGKLLRVEECRSHYVPYWNNYRGPEKEEETDWKAFLMHLPYRPFNPDQHAAWMGYRDFSTGTVGGWMSHFSDFIHYVTGCGFPVHGVAQGGIYSPTSVKGRTCPDTVTVILEYAEGFTTSYTTHFGNAANNYTIFFGSKGIMEIGYPDGNSPGGINPRVSGEGSEHPEKVSETMELEEIKQDDHMLNWLKCMRSRKAPHADMEAGYMQGVAVVLGDRAWMEGRKMVFDPGRREIRPV